MIRSWVIAAGGKARAELDLGMPAESLSLNRGGSILACGGGKGLRLFDASALVASPPVLSVWGAMDVDLKQVALDPEGRFLAGSRHRKVHMVDVRDKRTDIIVLLS